MNVKVYATNFLNREGEASSIWFDVVFEDEMGEKTNIGRYSVDTDDCVTGELDDYILSTHPEFYQRAKQIMLDHGLAEIVGDSVSPENYFYKNSISSIKGVSGIFERSKQYIENNQIPCTNKKSYLDLNDEISKKR